MDLQRILVVSVLAVFVMVPCLGQELISEGIGLAVMQGSNITLFCEVKNLGASNVFWLHDGIVLSLNHMIVGGDDERLSIKGRYNLRIENIQLSDEGSYICQVSTTPVMMQKSFINVTVPPSVMLVNTNAEMEATLGDNVTFQCSAEGRPSPNITWSREGSDLPSGEEYVMGDTITLTNLQYDHGGIYKCVAFNGVGEPDEDGVKLDVYYPPVIHSDANKVFTGPGVHTAIPCVASAQPEPRIEWMHNGTILELRELPQHKEILVKENGYEVDYSLLIRGVEDSDLGSYTCTVTNTKGKASIDMTLTAVPSKIEIVSSEKGDYSTEYDVQWNVTAIVSPTYYRLLLREVNDTFTGEWSEVNIKAEPTPDSRNHHQSYHIKGLASDSRYELVMKAQNRYGWGDASKRFFFTTNEPGFTPPPTTILPPVSHHGSSVGDYSGNSGGRVSPRQTLLLALTVVAMATTIFH